ncbi:pentapeptide repeat-containing protein [Streptomyces sp. NPDC002758]
MRRRRVVRWALTRADLRWADLTSVHLGHAILVNARLEGAILTDVHLRDADLTGVVGLTVEQVVSAHPAPSTKLPTEIASDPSVIARIEEVEEASRRRAEQRLTTWCAIEGGACWPGGSAWGGHLSALRSETRPAMARWVWS